MFATAHARSRGIPQRLRRALSEQISQRTSLRPDRARRRKNRELRTRGVADRYLWWQFKLARTGLVPDQLSAHRVTPAISSLLRGRFQGGVPDRLRPIPASERSRQRTLQSVDQTLAAR